ncbi:MAG: CDP-glycerol glycerophosphotransferase family protein [Clostridiales Family XIII bacterium]|nr:CDP-glycerol glycerophosphotransferase family protein [Clostridiales Family XIII bacterium]
MLRFVYFFIKLRRPQGDKVLLVSGLSGEPIIDISMLAGELSAKYPGIEAKVISERMGRSMSGVFAFIPGMLLQMREIAGAKVVVLDRSNIAANALRHREGTKIVQIWHAPDAIKKFGYQVTDMKGGLDGRVAEVMCVHKNYDYILCPSKAVEKAYCEAFGAGPEKMLPGRRYGMPRIDRITEISRKGDELRHELRESILREHPDMAEGRIALYAPTFRDVRATKTEELVNELLERGFAPALKLHPLEEGGMDDSHSAMDWFAVADFVITDYSSLAVEAAAAGLPLYFYVYDIEEYTEERGLNYDLRDEAISPYVFTDAGELAEALDSDGYDYDRLKDFRYKHLECPPTGNTEALAGFIASLVSGEDPDESQDEAASSRPDSQTRADKTQQGVPS